MNIEKLPLNLHGKKLSNYDIGANWLEVMFEYEKYLLEVGFHSLNEVPHNSMPLDDSSLDEEFVWLPWFEGNARILVSLPLADDSSKVFKNINSRLAMVHNREIVGIGQPAGLDNDTYEYYVFNFGPDLVVPGTKLYYDEKEVEIKEPSKRLGNGIKERFFASGGAGLQLGGGGGGGFGSGPGIPLEGAPLGFLWKPFSDSNGNLVVLLPERGGSGYVTVNGVQGTYAGNANGGRDHYRFPFSGGSLPPNTVVSTSSGTYTIPFPGERHEGAGSGGGEGE